MTTILLLGDGRLSYIRELLQQELIRDNFVVDVIILTDGTYKQLTDYALSSAEKNNYDQIYVLGGIWDCLVKWNDIWCIRSQNIDQVVNHLLEQQRTMLMRLRVMSKCVVITDLLGIDIFNLNNGIWEMRQSQYVIDQVILNINLLGKMRLMFSELCTPPFVDCLYDTSSGKTVIVYNRGFHSNLIPKDYLIHRITRGLVEAVMLNRQVMNEINDEDLMTSEQGPDDSIILVDDRVVTE